MKLSELINRLQTKLQELGDITAEVRNAAGEFDEVSCVERVNIGTVSKPRIRVFIDV
jgi:hypothetical protein